MRSLQRHVSHLEGDGGHSTQLQPVPTPESLAWSDTFSPRLQQNRCWLHPGLLALHPSLPQTRAEAGLAEEARDSQVITINIKL